MIKYDTVILGGGPAGLSAAIYSARYGLKTLIISRNIGGTANLAHSIENYPGYEGPGFELMQKFYKQAKQHGAEYLNEDILELKKEKEFRIITRTKMIETKTVIIALGSQRKKLNIPGEDKFLGSGVSYCATCDAAFFKNKNVAVAGGGEAACKSAVLLSEIARKVYLIHRGKKENCPAEAGKLNKKNIEFVFDAHISEIKGGETVTEIVLDHQSKKQSLKVEGVFIEAGSLPVSDIAKMINLKIDLDSFIIADNEMKTNVPGIFAAGDIVKSKMKQVVLAAAQGAMAAKSAYDFVKTLQ